MSAPGRPKRESFERQREGSPGSAPGRPKRESFERQREGSPGSAPGRPRSESFERQRQGGPRSAGRVVATLLALLASSALAQGSAPPLAKATFAGGCFWCVEADFDKVDGVVSTTSGYIGGRNPNPTYEQVSAGGTGHVEAVEIVYDPRKVSYEKLLQVFWVNVDPTVKDRQFCDVGPQYRTAIFVHDEAQRRAAEASKAALERSKPFRAAIVTPIEPATAFYPAEAYHQDYYLKNPVRYRYYRSGCGRDARLKELWGDRAPK